MRGRKKHKPGAEGGPRPSSGNSETALFRPSGLYIYIYCLLHVLADEVVVLSLAAVLGRVVEGRRRAAQFNVILKSYYDTQIIPFRQSPWAGRRRAPTGGAMRRPFNGIKIVL